MKSTNKPNPEKKEPKKSSFSNYIFGAIFLFLALSFLYSLVSGNGNAETKTVSLSEVARTINAGEVKQIVVSGDTLEIVKKDETKLEAKKESEASLSETLSSLGVPADKIAGVDIEVKSESGLGYVLLNIAPIVLPVILLIVFIWLMSRRANGAGMQAFSFGQSKAKITDPNDKNNRVTFKDVAGAKEAKEELKEIVDFLKNPKKFLEIGARIPKGVLLTGSPGTGKTLLARAVAGEAGVPFFHLSGSEFVEMFVGVGASRVRDLFELAKKAAPAIIFIDEIDAVGRVRGSGYGGGNDEREQTLNQILVEMDGFEPNEKVIIMAATNRPDVLDPALLRPGRFDRRVILDLPDLNDRQEILAIHALKKPLGEDVNLRVVAERTPGFSGADLHSLMNEGAILAAREDRKKVTQYDLLRAIEKVMLGPERKSHLLSPLEKKITAYHEAGHAILSSVLPHADPVHKVTIISRGRALGYTFMLPIEERKLQSRNEFLDSITVSLGGYVTEKMIFGDITTGPSNDLQVSTNLARAMVTRWGMSDAIGPIALESDGGRPLSGMGSNGNSNGEHSEKIGALIDTEVEKIMKDCHQRAIEEITKHRKVLDAIAIKLIEVETLEQEEYDKIIIANGILPKKIQKAADPIIPIV
ncbi:MAG: ATP-dependent zinc metalloprotease FtsH [Candidatus Pacebacteria bacterium]|nr:ATP-dependent zinc metalloprotease FtsH [Candidatus Paceibacterota bacterium]MBP9852262.1 ATP-dependent zinc metalloprotease FtsH [Candidatus Paceibacterota bacterium]